MTRLGKSKLTFAAALLASAMVTSASMAAPAAAPAAQGLSNAVPSSNVELVRSRGHHGWRGHRHRHGGWGWGAGAAAAGLLLTAPLWAGAYDDGPYYDEGYGPDYAYEGRGGGYERCEATFKSFDARSGTYMGYDGIRRRCPYL